MENIITHVKVILLMLLPLDYLQEQQLCFEKESNSLAMTSSSM